MDFGLMEFEPMKEVLIMWTFTHNSFSMGGYSTGKIRTEFEPIMTICTNKADFCITSSPDGETFVAIEPITGAIVNNKPSLREIILDTLHDLSTADPKILEKQLYENQRGWSDAKELSPEEFWERIS